MNIPEKQTPAKAYPKDVERKILVSNQLYKHGLTITELARVLNMNQGNLSSVIWGTRRSMAAETRIAEFFGLERELLFPPRTRAEIRKMREKDAA